MDFTWVIKCDKVVAMQGGCQHKSDADLCAEACLAALKEQFGDCKFVLTKGY